MLLGKVGIQTFT